MSWEGDWTSAEALRGRRPIAVLNQLRAALVERAKCCNISSVNVPILVEGKLVKSWLTSFVSLYNAVANPSNTKWTIADESAWGNQLPSDGIFVDTISAPLRINGEWAFDLYQKINKKKWTTGTSGPIIIKTLSKYIETRQDEYTWSETVDEFNSLPLNLISGIRLIWQKYSSDEFFERWGIFQAVPTIEKSAHVEVDYDVKAWIKTVPPEREGREAIYEGNTGSWSSIEDEWFTADVIRLSDYSAKQIFGNPSNFTAPPYPPATGLGQELASGGIQVVQKFDVPGGFSYGDW